MKTSMLFGQHHLETETSPDSQQMITGFRPPSLWKKLIIRLGTIITRNQYACTDHPEASRVVDACLVIEEVIE